MKILAYSCSFSLLLFSWALSQEESLKIDVKSDTLKLTGSITNGDAARFKKAVQGITFKQVIVNSPGGNVSESIEIANYIFDHKLPVTVREICASSCANYWLAASPKVIVEQGGFVSMHGNARHALGKANLFLRLVAGGMIRQENAFFKRVGVDSSLSYLSGEYVGQIKSYWVVSQEELNCYGYQVKDYIIPDELPENFKSTRMASIKPKLKCNF